MPRNLSRHEDGRPIVAVLAACRRLAAVPESELRQVASACHRQALAPGQAAYRSGEKGRSMFLVETGRIASRIRSTEGQLVDVGFAGPGGIFGYFELFDGGLRDCDAVAVRPSQVIVIPHQAGLRLLTTSTLTLLDVIGDLLSIVREQSRATSTTHFETVPVRLAGLLLEVSNHRGRVLLDGPQSLLANRLGTTRQTLSKALRALVVEGLITVDAGGRGVTIVDRVGLAELTGR